MNTMLRGGKKAETLLNARIMPNTELSNGKAGGTYIYHRALLVEFDAGANSKARVRDQRLKVDVNRRTQNRADCEVSLKSQQKLIKHQEGGREEEEEEEEGFYVHAARLLGTATCIATCREDRSTRSAQRCLNINATAAQSTQAHFALRIIIIITPLSSCFHGCTPKHTIIEIVNYSERI
jgi:hypothetical protein